MVFGSCLYQATIISEQVKKMPLDQVDEAQIIQETHISAALSNRNKLTIPFSGRCMCCDEPVDQRRFCDADCRISYEKELIRTSRI